MSQQTAPLPSPAPDHPPIHSDTLGQHLVWLDEQATGVEIKAAEGEAQMAWRERLQSEKQDPRFIGLGQRALARMGVTRPLMTREEMDQSDTAFVEYVYSLNPYKKEAGSQRQRVQEGLDDLRQEIKDLSARMPIGGWFAESLSPFQREQYLSTPTRDAPKVIDWLTETKYQDMPDGTPEETKAREQQRYEDDQRLLNFLQAHKHYIEQRQQKPEFVQATEAAKTRWTAGVERGVREGWLDDSVPERAAKLDDVKIYEGDAFSTLLKERGGYHVRGSRNVVVAKEAVNDAAVHELNHALLYGGGTTGKVETTLDHVFIDEALTEHLAQVIEGRTTVENIEPETGTYEPEREILKTLIRAAWAAEIDLSVSAFTRAYSAVGEKRDALVEVINEKLRQAFPVAHRRMQGAGLIDKLEYWTAVRNDDPTFMPGLTGRQRLDECTRQVGVLLNNLYDVEFKARSGIV